jgi:hypothetical protein
VERTRKVALSSVGVGLAVLGLKFAAYWLTGSVALYSDPMLSWRRVVTGDTVGSGSRATVTSGRPYQSVLDRDELNTPPADLHERFTTLRLSDRGFPTISI